MTLACAVNLQHREARLLTFYGTLFDGMSLDTSSSYYAAAARSKLASAVKGTISLEAFNPVTTRLGALHNSPLYQ